jgi:hypothetical protein
VKPDDLVRQLEKVNDELLIADRLWASARMNLTAVDLEDMLRRTHGQADQDRYERGEIASTAYVNSKFDYCLLRQKLEEMFPFISRTEPPTYIQPRLYGIPLRIDPDKAQPYEIALRDKDDALVARADLGPAAWHEMLPTDQQISKHQLGWMAEFLRSDVALRWDRQTRQVVA